MQEVSTTPRRPRRRGQYVVVAVVVVVVAVAAALALAVWVVSSATTSGAGTEDLVPKAGTPAVIHDDAGSVGDVYYPLPHGKVAPGAGSAVLHDDAGNMPTTSAVSTIVHDDAGNVNR